MRPTTLILAAALAWAPALVAQDSTASGTGSDPRIQATLQAALAAGIPVDLLERKIAEGKAKGVPMDRIAQAVQTRLDALTKAQQAMAKGGVEHPDEGDLSVAADALQNGVSATALATISGTAPQDRREVAIAVLSELVALGRASDAALAQVQAALAHGPEALANLQGEAAANAHGGDGNGGGAAAQVGVGAGAQVGVGAAVQVGAPRGR